MIKNKKITFLLISFLIISVTKIKWGEGSETIYAASNQSNSSATNSIECDYSQYFNGINGCAIFYNVKNKVCHEYNKELCKIRSTPCSTFKVISTLLGIKTGVIQSSETTMDYDGTIYPMKEWNQNLDLSEAFKKSCVWYYRKLIDQVGQKETQAALDDLKYGNCDISNWKGTRLTGIKDLEGFWLESSLKISPVEQVHVLSKIFNLNSIFKESEVNLLKKVMKIDISDENEHIFGKTGEGYNKNAWFVGLAKTNSEEYYFAIKLDDPTSNEATGKKAKEIAISIIKEHYFTT